MADTEDVPTTPQTSIAYRTSHAHWAALPHPLAASFSLVPGVARTPLPPDLSASSPMLMRVHLEGDRVMLFSLLVMTCFSGLLACWQGTWIASLILGPMVAGTVFLLHRWFAGSAFFRMVMAAALMVLCALLIHEMRGALEMHFGILVLIGGLLYYRDWRPIVIAAAVTLGLHLAVCEAQMMGYPVYVLPRNHSMVTILWHAGFVGAQAGMACYMAVRARADVLEMERNAAEAVTQSHRSGAALDGVREAIGEFALIGERIAASIVSQKQQVHSVSAAMQHMSASASTVADESHRSVSANALCLEKVERGKEGTEGAASMMRQMDARVKSISGQMNTLEQAIGDVGGVVGLIDQIAHKTNLLALNASIEAARAGAVGRGFGVVAQEIRNLAESTHASTARISGEMRRVLEASREVRQMIDAGSILMKESLGQLEAVGLKLEHATESTRTIAQGSQQIAASVEEQRKTIRQIGDSIAGIERATEDYLRDAARMAKAGRKLRTLEAI